jgi:hypothetical protein
VRRVIGPLLAVVVLVAAAIAVLTYLSEEKPQDRLMLVGVDGDVTVTGSDGHADVASEGTELMPLDRIATGQASRAELVLGDETSIKLAPSSSIQVTGQDDHTVTLELEGGRLTATVRPGTSALRVGSHGRQLLTTDGSFQMGLYDDGRLEVEVDEGAAMTSGFEGVSGLSAGERASVDADGQATVTPVSDELLLAVQWPEAHRTRDETYIVKGATVPGGRVRVEGGVKTVEVVADPAGAFEAHIQLVDGHSRPRVEVVDALGNVAAVDGLEVELDRHGPTFRGGVEYATPPEKP